MKKYKAVMAFVMCLTMGLCACGGNSKATTEGAVAEQAANESLEETQGANENRADIQKQDVQKSGASVSVKETEQSSGGAVNGRKVVTGGFMLTLPEYLTPTVNDQGLILSDVNMNYQMLVAVREYSFEDKKKDKDSLAANVRAAEYEITKDVEIVTVAGREFAYFNYMDGVSHMMLAYSAADADSTFANLVLRYGDMSDEEILTDIAELLETSEATDLPDTTLDDIVEENALAWDNTSTAGDASGYASYVENANIAVGENTVVITVPEMFYMMDFSTELENASIRNFVSSDETVDVMVTGADTCAYEDMETWVKESMDIPDDAENISVSKVQQEQAGDLTVYYQVGNYEAVSEYSGDTHSYLVLEAVAELPQGGYLQLSAESAGDAGLSFEMVRDFFQIK